jgi:hypothetical protein
MGGEKKVKSQAEGPDPGSQGGVGSPHGREKSNQSTVLTTVSS